jgi:hypothetical protein
LAYVGYCPDPVEVLLDDLLWAVDHADRPDCEAEARAIIVRVRAHNEEWHRARAWQRRTDLVVDLREPAADRLREPAEPGSRASSV